MTDFVLLQGVLKKKNSPRLCDGICTQAGRTHLEALLTSIKTVRYELMRPDSITFIHEWSWSLQTVPLHPFLFTLRLWGEKDALHLWLWWRPTEQVFALSSQDTPGPQRVTSAPPCTCRSMTEFLWMYLTPVILLMHITPTSLVFTRSEVLEVMCYFLIIVVLLQWKNVDLTHHFTQMIPMLNLIPVT